MHLNPKLLLQLVEIVERGSLTDAADAMSLTQPALSRNLKELERQMGTSVLVRDRHGARLTEFGARIYPYAQSMRTSLERIAAEAQSWQHGEIGTLRIGATPHPARMLPKVLSTFLNNRSGVSASMVVSGILPLIESLSKGDLDLIIGPIGAEATPSGVIASVLFVDELALFSGVHHPLAKQKSVSPEDLSGMAWLGTSSDSALRRQGASILVSMGITNVRYNLVVDGIENGLDVLEAGEHLAILPRRPLQNALKLGQIVELPIELTTRQWPIAVMHHNLPEMPQLTKDFVEELKHQFQ